MRPVRPRHALASPRHAPANQRLSPAACAALDAFFAGRGLGLNPMLAARERGDELVRSTGCRTPRLPRWG